MNLNGEKSVSCKKCVIDRKIYMESVVEFKKEVKKGIIRKNGCSCEICKKIYLKPETDNSGVVELSTYEIDDISYVIYKDQEYRVDDFLDEFEEVLELRILEHDHLTEEEQRERGLLGENDIFVPKKCNVSVLQGEESTRLETAKTQLIDSKCHLGETKRRAGETLYPRSKFYEEKLAYVNNLKCKGCSVCGFYDPDLLRFLDFDHLDVEKKVDSVAEMVDDRNYSMEDLIKETDESITRILCKFCHAIHTDGQRKAGIIKYT
jgi:ferredoxin